MITLMSLDELNENRNLMWNKRVEAHFILIFSTEKSRVRHRGPTSQT